VTGGVILAAGAARRFGSAKQLAELDGRPLLQHAIDAMLAVPEIKQVVVVLGYAAERVREAIDLGPARAVVCDEWEEGMAASLRCGVQALGPCGRVVVTLGDQPRMTAEAIAAVLAAAGADVAAARATYGGVPGHPVVLGAALLPRVLALTGDAGARHVLEGVDVRTVEAGHLCHPDDVDTPEELQAVRA